MLGVEQEVGFVADYSNSEWLERNKRVAANPASPTGLVQTAEDMGPEPPADATGSYSLRAQSWFTGRNTAGTANGWDTDFYRKAWEQKTAYEDRAQAAADGRLYYDWLNPEKNKDATGVALWDDPRIVIDKGGRKEALKRGDVLQGGKWTNNVYEDMDATSANTMLGAFLFDGRQQAMLGEGFSDAVAKRLDENTEQAAGARSAGEYGDRVDEVQREWSASGTDTRAVGLGGFAGGAAIGAGIGASVGAWLGPGALVTGAVGALIGGLAGGGIGAGLGLLNKDQISEAAARSEVQARMAGEKWGATELWTERASGFGALFTSSINPLQNAVQGTYDWRRGVIGDGEASFYELDTETGEVGANTWWKTANVVAAFGDSILQFASPIGRATYIASMSAHTIPSAIQLANTDHVFNPETGLWDDLQGTEEHAKAWGALGIDVLQIGIARGLGKAAASSRAIAQGKEVPRDGGWTTALDRGVDRAYARLRSRSQPGLADELATGAVTVQTVNGIRYFRRGGETVGSRGTLQMFVPSEFMKWGPTGFRARRMAAARNEIVPTADDFYRAGMQMMTQGSAFSRAVLNGYAEGSEEMLQAYLEPGAYGGTAAYGDIFWAGALGFASGAGMSAGPANRFARAAEIYESRARAHHMLRTGNLEMTDAEWRKYKKTLTKEEFKALAMGERSDAENVRFALDGIAHFQANEDSANPLGLALLADQNEKAAEKKLKDSQPSADGAMTIIARQTDYIVAPDGSIDSFKYRPDEHTVSAKVAQELLARQFAALQVQQREAVGKVRDSNRAAAALVARINELSTTIPAMTDPVAQAEAQAELDRAQADLVLLRKNLVKDTEMLKEVSAAVRIGRGMMAQLEEKFAELWATTRWSDSVAKMEEINRMLRDGSDGRWTDSSGRAVKDAEVVRQVTELYTGRHPEMDSGSHSIIKLQISESMTRLNQHGSVGRFQGTLKPLQADHDGDKQVTFNFAWVPRSVRQDLRLGMQSFQQKEGSRPEEGLKEWVIDPLDDEAQYIDVMSNRLHPLSREEVAIIDQAKLAFQQRFLDKYTGRNSPFDRAEVQALLDVFLLGVTGGVKKARLNFLNGLLNLKNGPAAFREMGIRLGHRSAVQEMTQDISLFFAQTQQRMAAHVFWNDPAPPRAASTRAADALADLRAVSAMDAATRGVDMGLATGTTDPTRQGQSIYFVPFFQAAIKYQPSKAGLLSEQALELSAAYQQLSSGEVETAVTRIVKQDRINARVLFWLRQAAEAAAADFPALTIERRMLVLAQTAVRDIRRQPDGSYVVQDGTVSLLQQLLGRSLDIEEYETAGASDEAAKRSRITTLRRMTEPQKENSYTASQALIEVFGERRLTDLLEDSENPFINSTYTLQAQVLSMQGMHEDAREREIHKLKRYGGEYRRGADRRDAPYGYDQLKDGTLNVYTVLVDAVTAMSRVHFKNVSRRNGTVHDSVIQGLNEFTDLRREWRNRYGDVIRAEQQIPPGTPLDESVVLDHMLRNPDIIRVLLPLFPEDARHILAQVRDGQVWTANWIRAMLLESNAEKAALMLFVNSRLAILNALGASIKIKDDGTVEEMLVTEKHFDKVKSRFLQTVLAAAVRGDGGMSLGLLIRKISDSNSLADLFDFINKDTQLRGYREQLLPWFDNVSDFQVDPSTLWINGVSPDLQRDALLDFGPRMKLVGQASVNHLKEAKEEDELVQRMLVMQDALDAFDAEMEQQRIWDATYVTQADRDAAVLAGNPRPEPVMPDPSTANDGTLRNHQLLRLAIRNGQLFGDGLGANVRNQYALALLESMIVTHNKGAADARVKNIGEGLATMFGFGMEQGGPKQLSALTSMSMKQIRTNPTALTSGPVRIQFDDGSEAVVDFSSPRFVLEMLADRRTRALAKIILGQTVRDVDGNNSLQFYQDAPGGGTSLQTILNEAALDHLYVEDGRPSYQQALRIVDRFDTFARTTTADKSAAERKEGYFPVQRVIDKIVVAVSQRPGFDTLSAAGREGLLQQITIDVAMMILDLGRIDPSRIGSVRTALRDRMISNYTGRHFTSYENMSYEERRKYDMYVVLFVLPQLSDDVETFSRLARDARRAKDPAKEKLWRDRQAEAQKLFDDISQDRTKASAYGKGSYQYTSPEVALGMFEINQNWDPSTRLKKKQMVIGYLQTGLRYLQYKDQKDVLQLIDIIKNTSVDDPRLDDPGFIDADAWAVLQGMAAAAWQAEGVVHSGSGVTRLPIDTNPDNRDTWQYHDKAFTGIFDELFTSPVLDASRVIRSTATGYLSQGAPGVLPNLTETDFMDRIEKGVLSRSPGRDYFSTWTDRVPIESMKARRVLEGTSVGSGIQVAGIDPKTLADMVAKNWVTWEKEPQPQHLSNVKIVLGANEDLIEVLGSGRTPLGPAGLLKLDRHFVESVKIRGASVPLSPGQNYADAMDASTHVSTISSQVAQSRFRYLDLVQLQRHIGVLRAKNGVQDIEIEIDYVDVDKLPYTGDPTYTNSVYFDGVGRNEEGISMPGPIAALFFSTGAWSKQGQQGPLDFAARGGSAFEAFMAAAYSTVARLEASATTVSELMHAKAMEMWLTEFETDRSLGDINAHYKMVKSRHVVAVLDPADPSVIRKATLKWPEELIEQESAGTGIPLSQLRIINLNDRVARTIYGSAATGQSTVAGRAMSEPLFDLTTANPRPALDWKRLDSLGLSRLGQVVANKGVATGSHVVGNELGNTELGAFVMPAKAASILETRGVQEPDSAYIDRISVLADNAAVIHQTRRGQISVFDVADRRKLGRDIQSNLQAQVINDYLFWRMGIPGAAPIDNAKANAQFIESMLDVWGDDATSPRVPWSLEFGNNFTNSKITLRVSGLDKSDTSDPNSLAMGDIVFVELRGLAQMHPSDMEAAVREGKEILRKLAAKGVSVVLRADAQGDGLELKDRLGSWLLSGATDYVPVIENSTFAFKLREPRSLKSRNIEALASKDLQIDLYSPEGAMLQLHLGEGGGGLGIGLNEGASIVNFEALSRVARPQGVKIPSSPMIRAGSRGPTQHLAFSYVEAAVTGPDHRASTTKALLDLLKTQEGRDFLLGLMKGNKDYTDPPGVSPYKEHPVKDDQGRDVALYDVGLRSAEDALEKLKSTLEQGRWPGEKGDRMLGGDIIPYRTNTGEILLMRIGFKIPDPDQARQQLRRKLDKQGLPMKIVASSPEISPEWTVAPGPFTVVERTPGLLQVEYDPGTVLKTIGMSQKTHGSALPAPWVWPDVGLGANAGAGNTFGLIQLVSHKGSVSKGDVLNAGDNFSDWFSIMGFDGREYLLNSLLGFKQRTPTELESEWLLLKPLLDEFARSNHGYSRDDLRLMLNAGTLLERLNDWFAEASQTIPAAAQLKLTVNPFVPLPTQRLNQQQVNNYISMALLIVMMSPGYTVDHIVRTPGFATIADSSMKSAEIARLPTMLTDAFASQGDVATHLIDKMNERMPWKDFHAQQWIPNANDPTTGALRSVVVSKPVYRINPDLTLTVVFESADGRSNVEVRALPQVAKHTFADENSLSAMHNMVNASWQTPTEHVSHTLQMLNSGKIILDSTRGSTQDQYKQENIVQFTDADTRAQNMWDMLNSGAANTAAKVTWDTYMRAEEEHIARGFKKTKAYRKEVDKTGKEWAADMAAIDTVVDEILNMLNLAGSSTTAVRKEVDYLVRQFLGQPGKMAGQKDFQDIITPGLYLQAARLIRDNVKDYRNPLNGGMVPMPHKAFWQMVYTANMNAVKPWAPRRNESRGKVQVARDWDEWCGVLVAQVLDSTAPFHSMFQVDLDGMWHSYYYASPLFDGMAVSMSDVLAATLMDKGVQERRLSLDPVLDAALGHQGVLDAHSSDYLALTSRSSRTVSQLYGRAADASELKQQLDRQKTWLAGKKLKRQKEVPLRDYVQEGAQYIDSSRKANKFLRNTVNWSIANRIALPPLYLSAWLEVPYRMMQESATDLLTGQGIGVAARASNAVRRKLQPDEVADVEEGTELGWYEKVKRGTQQWFHHSLEPAYTAEQEAMLDDLAKQLGHDPVFIAMIEDESTYKMIHGAQDGDGPITRGLEKTAGFVTRNVNDPTRHAAATSLARAYLGAVWEEIHLLGSTFTVEEFVNEMRHDATWLRNQYEGSNATSTRSFNPHRAGVNRILQIRSQRPTLLSKTLMSPIDTLCGADAQSAQILGHALKIPFAFTTFNMNALLTMTGLNGFDQAFAFMLGGRRTPMGWLKKEPTSKRFEFQDVLETMDLQRTFIRSGTSLSMLFIAGMMAGGLGGEDEEERRRRRMNKYLGIVDVNDPREPHNKLMYSEAIFLDSIPILGNLFKREDNSNAVMPHWVIKQFLSPVLGIARFFENGDFREVTHGYWDAFTAVPTSVMRVWNEADQTARLMFDEANEHFASGTEDGTFAGVSLLTSIVNLYQNALFENGFANSLYVASDTYDRDPFVIPMTADENTGELDRTQGLNLPQETNALMSYRDPETGEIRQGYAGRSGAEAAQYQRGENKLTYALWKALWSGDGLDSTFLRWNMAPKQRTIDLPDKSRAEMEAFIMSAYEATGGQPLLTVDEISRMLKKEAEDSDIWWDEDMIQKEAIARYEAQPGQIAGLAAITPEGRAVMTTAAADSIFTSLARGRLKLGDPALQGFGADQEMRDEIAAIWKERIIDEGVALGLPPATAAYRWSRIWYGDDSNPEVPGLKYVLYDKSIPDRTEVTYNQLNVSYVMGPDGRPWATPFSKRMVIQPFQRVLPPSPGMAYNTFVAADGSIHTTGTLVDLITGIDTGLVGLERTPFESRIEVPKDPENDSAEKTASSSKGGWSPWFSRRYPRRGYGGGGGGGGGGYFQRMQPFPGGTGARVDDVPFINTGSPIIRRADIRRERITSERGRLKQWQ